MIAINIPRKRAFQFCKQPQVLLAFIWCLALTTGVLFTASNQDLLLPLVYTLPMRKASMVGLAIASLTPILVSVASAKFSILTLLYAVVFFDGLSRGAFLSAAFLVFGSSTWLACGLFAFARFLMVVPRLILYSRCVSQQPGILLDSLHCFVAATLALIIEHIVISPLIATLVFIR